METTLSAKAQKPEHGDKHYDSEGKKGPAGPLNDHDGLCDEIERRFHNERT